MVVIKRNGTEVPFDKEKIVIAVMKAFASHQPESWSNLQIKSAKPSVIPYGI